MLSTSGAAPGIDRLIVVADAAQVAVRPGEQAQPQVLGDVGVLIFVDQDVAESMLVLFEHLGVALEEFQRQQQKVAEIDGVEGPEAVLVLAVEGEGLAGGGLRALGRPKPCPGSGRGPSSAG